MACLSCEELEELICSLAEEISSLTGCEGVRIKDDGEEFDYTIQTKAKIEALRVYESLYKLRCGAGAGELYEFVHVPCVKPATCAGTTCATPSRSYNRRRYRA